MTLTKKTNSCHRAPLTAKNPGYSSPLENQLLWVDDVDQKQIVVTAHRSPLKIRVARHRSKGGVA
jgi:hypothetical protein